MKNNSVFDRQDATNPKSRYLLSGDKVLDPQGQEIGQWHGAERRVAYDWRCFPVSDDLLALAEDEATIWDNWANREIEALSRVAAQRVRGVKVWYERYLVIRQAVEKSGISLDLSDKRILDIGGSGKDLIYWIFDGPARVDQVEVSAASQRLCLERIRAIDAAHGTDYQDRVFFHTAPAETLPFEDDAFDFVFSRATIHHCKRPDAIDEIVRVLKPGGTMILIERYLSAPMYWLMNIWRTARMADRGSDNPLRRSEIVSAKTKFTSFYWRPYGGYRLFYYLLSKLGFGSEEGEFFEFSSHLHSSP